MKCDDIACYEDALLSCKKVSLIREDGSYTWRYEILGKEDKNTCDVQVILLKINQGELNVEDLQGESMVCGVKKVDDIFPEKDMLRCSGKLKEELQELIIDRMHNYLLQNLGEINEELREI